MFSSFLKWGSFILQTLFFFKVNTNQINRLCSIYLFFQPLYILPLHSVENPSVINLLQNSVYFVLLWLCLGSAFPLYSPLVMLFMFLQLLDCHMAIPVWAYLWKHCQLSSHHCFCSVHQSASSATDSNDKVILVFKKTMHKLVIKLSRCNVKCIDQKVILVCWSTEHEGLLLTFTE